MADRTLVTPVDHRNVVAALRRLALPGAMASAADQLLGIADTIVIGAFGASALAAITAGTSVFLALLIPLFAFNAGPRIMGAQAVGAGDMARFGRVVRASAVVPFAISILVILGTLGGARPLLHAILAGAPHANEAATYVTLRAFSLLPIIVTGTAIAAFGAAGDTGLSLRVLIAINAVHLPLLAVLALGVGTHHPLGIVGAGISSLLSEIVGAIYAYTELRRRSELRILSRFDVDLRITRQTFMLGLPEFVFLVLMVGPDPITIALLAPLGVTMVAGYRALSVVNDLMWAFPGSLGEASQIVVGQRLGAGDVAGARVFAFDAIRIGTITCAIAGAVVAVLAKPLAQLFTLNAALGAFAAGPLALHMVTAPLKGYGMTALAPIRASGDTRFSMILGVVSGGLGIAGIAVGLIVLHIGLWAVPLAWIVAWTARVAVTTIRLRSGNWEVRRLAA
jgi:putative MATE family efflux protein